MKRFSMHTLSSAFLLTLVSILVVAIYARNPESGRSTRLSRRAIERAEQARQDSLNHRKALAALEDNAWAFESERLTDGKGRPIDIGANPRPDVAGFDGTYLFALGRKANARLVSRKTNRKGEEIFRYVCDPPLRSECTLTLSEESDFAVFSIDGKRYSGRVMPIDESWYFMGGKDSRQRETW